VGAASFILFVALLFLLFSRVLGARGVVEVLALQHDIA
jgi:hypothetical protein